MRKLPRRVFNACRKILFNHLDIPTYNDLAKERPPVEGFSIQPTIVGGEKVSGEFLAARVSGSFGDYVDIMSGNISKHYSNHNKEGYNNEYVAIIDSYDGAQHLETENGATSVLSFSSTVFSEATINGGMSTSSPSNILTWG
eukprot:15326030-Ditylum_brightwellii.AAC.1